MHFKGKSIFDASFDVFAKNYHSVRPGYPSELYKDIKDVCGISNASWLLEIGAGSGIATIEIAKFGCQIVAIEPGAQLAAIARKQTRGLAKVQILEKTFEDFRSSERFDTILAFTSFHWLKSGDKYQEVLNLLNDSGSLVLVWNWFFQTNSPAVAVVNKVYHEFLSDVYPGQMGVAEVNEDTFSTLVQREREVVQNPLFFPVFLKKYLVEYNYNAQTYPKLLNTFPKVIEVEEQRRLRFLEHISKAVKKYGKISVPILTSLIICKRKDYFLKAVAGSRKEVR